MSLKNSFLLELLNVIFDFRKPYFKLLLVSCNVKPSVLQQIKEVKRPRNNQYLYNTILNTEFCATYSLNDEINFHKETRTAIEQAVDKFLLKWDLCVIKKKKQNKAFGYLNVTCIFHLLSIKCSYGRPRIIRNTGFQKKLEDIVDLFCNNEII